MILSMTGFAAVAAELPGVSLAVELRSVNHRYLDLSLRLPDELRAVEPALRETLAAALKRGKVECRIALNRTAQGAATLAVDAARDRPAGRGGVGSDAGRPGRRAAVRPRDPALAGRAGRADRAAGRARCSTRSQLVEQALAELAAARAREGAKTAAVLEACCAGIEAQVARVRAAHSGDPRRIQREARRAAARGRPRSQRGSPEAGARAVRDQDRRRRGARAADHARGRSPARAAAGRQRRQAARLPRAGTAPRGEHAGLEVGRRGSVAGGARAQGADRADARAGQNVE